MAPSSRDRISVDLRGLRAALLDQARDRGVTPSDLVRGALAEAPGDIDSDQRVLGSATHRSAPNGRVRLSLRLATDQARAITLAAKAAVLPTGDSVAGPVAGVPVLSAGANRTDHLAAFIASSAEISTLSRDIHDLTWLLRQGAFRPALEYRPMLDTLADDLRATWSWLRVFWPTCGLAAAAPMRQGIGLHSPPENAMSQPGTPTAS